MAGAAKKNEDGSWTVTNGGGVETRTTEAMVPPELRARAAAGDPLAETEMLEAKLGPKAFPGTKTDQKAADKMMKREDATYAKSPVPAGIQTEMNPAPYARSAVPPGIQREMGAPGKAPAQPEGDFIVSGGNPGDSLSRGREAFAHPGASSAGSSTRAALERGGSAVPRLDDSRGNLDPAARAAPPQGWSSEAERKAATGQEGYVPAWKRVEELAAQTGWGQGGGGDSGDMPVAPAGYDSAAVARERQAKEAAQERDRQEWARNEQRAQRAKEEDAAWKAQEGQQVNPFSAPPGPPPAESPAGPPVRQGTTTMHEPEAGPKLQRAPRPGEPAAPQEAPAGGGRPQGGPPPMPGHGATVREIRDYQTWLELNKPRGSSPIVHHPDKDQDMAFGRHWEGAPSKETKDAELHENLRAATFGADQARALDDMESDKMRFASGVPRMNALNRYVDSGTQDIRMERAEARHSEAHDAVFGREAESPIIETRPGLVPVKDAQGNPVIGHDGQPVMEMGEVNEVVKEGRPAVPPAMVDPGHFWESRTTGQKILAVISLALGGMGAGAAHQENLAAKVFGDAVKQDIAAQERNINEKKERLTLTGQLMREEIDKGNGIAAGRAKAEMAAITQYDLQMKAAALASNSPIAMRKYEIAHAQNGAAYHKALGDYEAVLAGKRDRTGKVIAAHTTGGMSAGPNWDKIAGWQKDAQSSEGHDATTQLTRANAQKAMSEAQAGPKDAPMVVPWGGSELVFRRGITSEAQTKTTEAMAAAEGVRSNIERLTAQQEKMGANTLDKKAAAAMVTTVAAQVNSTLGQGAMADNERENWVNALTGMRSADARAFMTEGLDNIVMGRVGVYMQGRVDPRTGKVVPLR